MTAYPIGRREGEDSSILHLSRSRRPRRTGHGRTNPLRRPLKNVRKVDFVISEVPHRKQRYETVGDWIPGDPVDIRVSRMKDQRYVFLVALHELIEYELCKKNGISDTEVVAFDVDFENERRRKIHPHEAEPGNDPRAPYRDEHEFASMIEMMMAQKLGVKWEAYEKALLELGPKQRRVAIRPMIKSR